MRRRPPTASVRYVILPEHAAEALALWCVHTYVLDAACTTPRLAVMSAEKRCGKSTLLVLLRGLVHRPLMAANVTTAAVFRVIEAHRPTLLVDEGDTFLARNEDLRGVLNSGHDRSGYVLRVVGDDHEVRMFATFAPVAIAAIGKLPDTIEDRAIPIAMRRRKTDERVDKLRSRVLERTLAPTRQRIVRWAGDHLACLREAEPEIPEALNDRAADGWHLLLAIADAAGPRWGRVARDAAVALHASREQTTDSTRVRLLRDLRALFRQSEVEALPSATIVRTLESMEECCWSEFKDGRPITASQVAKLLLPFGIRPKNLRTAPNEVRKGYVLRDCQDAFERYLHEPTTTEGATPLHPAPARGLPASSHRYADELVADPVGCNSSGGQERSAVAAQEDRDDADASTSQGRRCYRCGETRLWRSRDSGWVCERCPPEDHDTVEKRHSGGEQ